MPYTTKLCSVAGLKTREKAALLNLLDHHFDNVVPETFHTDLKEKDLVFLLFDSRSETLLGFSTQKIFTHTLDGRDCRIIFSGDTIVAPSAWGSTDFPMALITWMLSMWKENPSLPLYWMLLSMGIRTYRFLPLYFKAFFPCCDFSTPPGIRLLMDDLGKRRYPERYDPGKGIIFASPECCYLRDSLAVIPRARLRNRHVDFFLKKNPGYAAGDELLCLARIEPENIRPSILHRLARRQ